MHHDFSYNKSQGVGEKSSLKSRRFYDFYNEPLNFIEIGADGGWR